MAIEPVTREERFLAVAGGQSVTPPVPITRKEQLLQGIIDAIRSGGVTPDVIEGAVNDYLNANPVQPGATVEQAAQIEQNKNDIADLQTEVDELKESGGNGSGENVELDTTLTQSGKAADAKATGDEIKRVEGKIPNIEGLAKSEDIPTKPEDIGAQPKGNYLTEAPVTTVNGKTGDVRLGAADVGARPDTWVPTAQEVGALPNTYVPPTPTAEQVGADPTGTAASVVSVHNTSGDAHNDIRLEVKAIREQLSAFLDVDEETLNELSELISRIVANQTSIEQLTAGKVNVSDIVDDLTTNVANKTLSAAQGVALKTLIDGLSSGKLDASKLQEAINTALAQAKANGEFDGKDGVSPTVAVSAITGGHRVSITDKGGTKTVDVMDGKDGDPGDPGRGIKSIARTSGNGAAGTTDTYTITYTDNTTSAFTVRNGSNGAPGTAATFEITGVTALAYGAAPTVTEQSGSTAQAREYVLGIPEGKPGADGKTAYKYAQDGGYTGTEAEFAEMLSNGMKEAPLTSFIDNTDVDYAYDAETGVNYTVIRVYRDKIDGTKQFPFVVHTAKKSTYDLVMEHGYCLAINAGIFDTTTGLADGVVIQNGKVSHDGETVVHSECLPLTIDAGGNLSYASYDVSAEDLVDSGIVSAVTGFMPIIIDYQEYASTNWNSVSHYTENAQRQIIGQFGNGDYAIVTCEGRNYQNSDGWTIAEAQTVCKRLGLKFAYNLDGGGSTETMLGYKHLNTIYDGTTGRKVPTFIVFTGSTTLDVEPDEVPETFVEVEYVETSGDAYIRTNITEAATPFDYEAKILSTAEYTNDNAAQGHLFSATNTWYPYLRIKKTTGDVNRKINGTENSSGAYTNFVPNKWYTLSSTQNEGSNVTTLFDVEANKSVYTSTKVNGSTYDASKTFAICAYGADTGREDLRFYGKLSYIKLSLNGVIVHHFVAAKSSKTGVYGLLDKVTGVFYRSTSGTDFTGA